MKSKHSQYHHHFENGKKLYKEKDFEGALTKFSLAIELFPHVTLYESRSIVYEKLGLYDKALDDAKTMINLSNNPRGYLRRCSLYAKLSKYREALAAVISGLSFCSKEDETYSLLKSHKLKLEEKINKSNFSHPSELDPFNYLPIELNEIIMEYLTFKDKVQCMFVCQRWYSHLTNNGRIWKKVKLGNIRMNASRWKECLKIVGKHVVELDASGALVNGKDFSRALKEKIPKALSRLDHLSFANVRDFCDKSLSCIFVNFPTLINLSLVDCNLNCSMANAIVSACPQLNYLNLAKNKELKLNFLVHKTALVDVILDDCISIDDRSIQVLVYCSKLSLQSVSLSNCNLLTARCLIPLSLCTNLMSVRLNGLSSISMESWNISFFNLMKTCPKLTSVELEDRPEITAEDIELVTALVGDDDRTTSFTVLNLSNNKHLLENFWSVLMHSCDKLSTLILNGCVSLKPFMLGQFVVNAAIIQEISLNDSPWLNNDAFCELLKSNSLKTVSVCGCANITGLAIQRLISSDRKWKALQMNRCINLSAESVQAARSYFKSINSYFSF